MVKSSVGSLLAPRLAPSPHPPRFLMAIQHPPPDPRMNLLPRMIFMSRWLQVPLYLGLIVAQCVYVWQFWIELVHLVEAALGNAAALGVIRDSVAVPGADPAFAKSMS